MRSLPTFAAYLAQVFHAARQDPVDRALTAWLAWVDGEEPAPPDLTHLTDDQRDEVLGCVWIFREFRAAAADPTPVLPDLPTRPDRPTEEPR